MASSKDTKKYYPYDFIFDVVYKVEDDLLYVTFSVRIVPFLIIVIMFDLREKII